MALGQTTARSESLEEDSQECLMFPTPGRVHIRENVGGRTGTAQLNTYRTNEAEAWSGNKEAKKPEIRDL